MGRAVALGALLVAACAGGGGPGEHDAVPATSGTITGTVWAPGNAPGMVPSGHEIPMFGALVYLSSTRPEPIPQSTYCDRCSEPPNSHVLSDHRGAFTFANVVPDTYWLVIQKGQFRLEQQVDVAAGTLELTASQTTIPSTHDPDGGAWLPRIAMAVGNYDALEDILCKMGIGTVDASGGCVAADAAAKMDIFSNGGSGFGGMHRGTLTDLVGDVDTLLDYHIVFIPCASTSNTDALDSQANLQNLRDFVAAGGKLYVTDQSGEWMDNVFPEQITLAGAATDTPASAYDRDTDTWDPNQFGHADGTFYDSDDGEVVDSDLRSWLDDQMGPTAAGGIEQYDADQFDVVGNWNAIAALTSVEVGVDGNGAPVYDEPRSWIVGSDGAGPKRPLTVTFEPAGCGRVLFSTYHTTDTTHMGLVPQERALLYLVMEIGVCSDTPVVE
jgi:hypothetical protein